MGNDHQELSSGTFSLVRQFEKKCRPTRVVHRFRQHASAQAFHLQVFDNDYSVFLDDLPRQLVFKIISLVENPAVNLRYQTYGFLPAIGNDVAAIRHQYRLAGLNLSKVFAQTVFQFPCAYAFHSYNVNS